MTLFNQNNDEKQVFFANKEKAASLKLRKTAGFLAEGQGFEPQVGSSPTRNFEFRTFDLSDNPPIFIFNIRSQISLGKRRELMKRTTVLNFRTCLEKTSQINGIGFYVNTKIRRFRDFHLRPLGHLSTTELVYLLFGYFDKREVQSTSCKTALFFSYLKMLLISLNSFSVIFTFPVF